MNSVESYKCLKCNQQIKVPRYTSIPKIWSEHQGGSAEMAIAFTSLCDILDYDSKICVDIISRTFWNEIYFDDTEDGYWIHVDVKNNYYDQPHVYEYKH
jgi:hypothetical protein